MEETLFNWTFFGCTLSRRRSFAKYENLQKFSASTIEISIINFIFGDRRTKIWGNLSTDHTADTKNCEEIYEMESAKLRSFTRKTYPTFSFELRPVAKYFVRSCQ